MMYALIQPVRLIVEWERDRINTFCSQYLLKAVLLGTGKRNESKFRNPWIKLVMRARIHAQFTGLDFTFRINCLIGIHAFKYQR